MASTLDRIGCWLRQSATGRWIGSRLGAAYIWLATKTTRWQIIGREYRRATFHAETGLIAVIWHGRLFVSPVWAPKGRRTVAMISGNLDGDLISGIVGCFGVFTVRGSTYDRDKRRAKGGSGAYSGAQRELVQNKAVVAIAPDGSRGPRMRAERGAAMLAIVTGSPILPVTFSSVRGKTLRSWDRFVVPGFFGRRVQIFGTPIYPPESDDDASVDALVATIDENLTEMTHRADEMCGRPRIEPGPPIAKP